VKFKKAIVVAAATTLSCGAYAASMLRITCDDSAVGAEIMVDKKPSGTCPIDLQVAPGEHQVTAVRKGELENGVFGMPVSLPDNAVKRIEVSVMFNEYTQKAADITRPLAEKGDAAAQAKLGDMYGASGPYKSDPQEALRWYRKAADQGNAYALRAVGDAYLSGRGVPKDREEARRFYKKSIAQGGPGSALAEYMLKKMDKEQ